MPNRRGYHTPSAMELLHMFGCARQLARKLGEWPQPSREMIEALDRRWRAWAFVACGNTFHIVAVSRRGRIALLGHPKGEMASWNVLQEMGGSASTLPECYRYLTLGCCKDVLGKRFCGHILTPAFWNWQNEAALKQLSRVKRLGVEEFLGSNG